MAISEPHLRPSRQALMQLNLKWARDGEHHLQGLVSPVNWGEVEDTLAELKQLKILVV